ncbi:BLUF domain-containing protein [Mesorhizobium sp. CAU 1741]|uniref:BLUF domain-containing protein n=1 Tax=Mesorhizobium sp. CAU 1741 TaxID=3140366 RepID=UPI00325A544C
MSVYQLLYASGATNPVTAAEIENILQKSRANNAALGITGLLLYADNMFIQVLEGNESDVRALAQRIKRDPRHRNFMELIARDAPGRAFDGWQMGFKRLSPDVEEDSAVFRASKQALEGRIGSADDGFMLDAVLAFAGRDFLASA